MVELFDFRKADVDLGFAAFATLGNELGQAVQGLRTEDHVDVGRPRHDVGALLAGHTTANADDQARPLAFERTHTTEVRKDLLLRLLSDRAGVEEDDIGLLDTVGDDRAITVREDLGHLVRVVLVHLAAECADV